MISSLSMCEPSSYIRSAWVAVCCFPCATSKYCCLQCLMWSNQSRLFFHHSFAMISTLSVILLFDIDSIWFPPKSPAVDLRDNNDVMSLNRGLSWMSLFFSLKPVENVQKFNFLSNNLFSGADFNLKCYQSCFLIKDLLVPSVMDSTFRKGWIIFVLYYPEGFADPTSHLFCQLLQNGLLFDTGCLTVFHFYCGLVTVLVIFWTLKTHYNNNGYYCA